MPQTGYKRFIMPVWVLAITAVLKSGAVVASVIAVKLYAERQGRGPVAASWWLDAGIVLLLIVQAVIYWKLQNQIFSRVWAGLHVYITLFVLLIAPLLVIGISILISYRLRTNAYLQMLSVINRLRLYLFWALLAAANVFFTANCIKSWRRPDESFREDIDAIGTE